MVAKNKGEWSEVLVLAQGLAEGKFPLVNERFDLLPSEVSFTAAKITPAKGLEWIRSCLNSEPTGANLALQAELRELAKELAQDLLTKHTGSFHSIPGNKIVEALATEKLSPGSKVDVWLKLTSALTESSSWRGFSVKSHVGGSPTLLNASSHTNFVFKVIGTTSQIAHLEGDTPVRKKVSGFLDSGGSLVFDFVSSEQFTYNLNFSDSRLAADLAEMLTTYYSGEARTVVSLIETVAARKNDFTYRNMLRHRVSRLLLDASRGMVPGSFWDGKSEVHGGFILVTPSAEIGIIPLENTDLVSHYLLSNTTFDTPSEQRHAFSLFGHREKLKHGHLFEHGGPRFALNLQIRFS